ncbi:MAG: hypothetical protein ACRBFS_09125 [Aureispira sp.]
MIKQQIEEQLSSKKEALEALLKQYNLTASTALTAQQLAIVKQAYQVLGISEAPLAIGKKTFIEYVQDWVKDFISILDEKRRTDIKIPVPDIITSLREKIRKPDFPISKLLWKHLKTEINKLASPTTAEGLRVALLNGFNAFNAEMGSKFMLTKHYKDNKATYRSIKKKDLNEQTMIANDFETWLNGILKVAKGENKEDKEKQQELENAFKVAYGEWLKDQRAKINNAISQDKGTKANNSMPLTKFIAILMDQSKEWVKDQPQLGQEIKERILVGLKGDSLAIKDYVNAMNAAYTNIVTPELITAKSWYDKKRFFDIVGLLTVLATENSGISKYDIIEEYIQWFSKVGEAVDSMKISPNRQFIAKKLIEGFQALLTTDELSFLLPKVVENIKAYDKAYLSVQEASKLWKKAIINSIKEPDTILATQAGKTITSDLLDSLDGLLLGQVNVGALQKMLQKALKPLPKPESLVKGDFVNVVIDLNDGTTLTCQLMTTIAKEKQKPYAYPSLLQLVVSQGKSPFGFVAKPVFAQSPLVAKGQVNVDFEYTIVFSRDKGTSEKGGGKAVDITNGTSLNVNKDVAVTTGQEITNSTGSNQTVSGSTTHGVTGKAGGSFLGLVSVEGETNHEVTVGGSQEWTSEHAVTDVNTTTTNTGVNVGVNHSTTVSNGSTWNRTMQHGKDEGYLTIKGTLTASNVKDDKMTLSISKVVPLSPGMKGLAIKKISVDSGKEVRWKK